MEKLVQAVNYAETRFDFGRPLKWIYIHGMHRAGTSYMLHKLMSKAKRGYGDSMLGQFAQPMKAVRTREKNRSMDGSRLRVDFRRKLSFLEGITFDDFEPTVVDKVEAAAELDNYSWEQRQRLVAATGGK